MHNRRFSPSLFLPPSLSLRLSPPPSFNNCRFTFQINECMNASLKKKASLVCELRVGHSWNSSLVPWAWAISFPSVLQAVRLLKGSAAGTQGEQQRTASAEAVLPTALHPVPNTSGASWRWGDGTAMSMMAPVAGSMRPCAWSFLLAVTRAPAGGGSGACT